MKYTLLTLGAVACALSGCAGVKVVHTDVATGATKPKAIYIRSYIADSATFKGNHGYIGERPIKRSLAPAGYSKALKDELEKIAPAMVLADDETPTTGWLVESDLEVVHAGSPFLRSVPVLGMPLGVGRSTIKVHVRITDVNATATTDKDTSKGGSGAVVYEFDLKGGSRASGFDGQTYAPGLGNAAPFDYKNAAERVYYALSVDPHVYGLRTSPTLRY